jgi:hypothetical protein
MQDKGVMTKVKKRAKKAKVNMLCVVLDTLCDAIDILKQRGFPQPPPKPIKPLNHHLLYPYMLIRQLRQYYY